MWGLAIAVLVGTAGWMAVSCGADRADAERPVTEDEAQLLAGMRSRNLGSEPVAIRMSLPVDGEQLHVDGYLVWDGPLLYARVPTDDGSQQLLQAIPGLVATHEDDAAFDEVAVPEDGWSPRQMLAGGASPAQSALDVLVSSMFTLASGRDDDPGYLAEHATWRDEGLVDGAPVETFRAPIMVDSGGGAATPEALYTLDESGDIRRFQVNTGGGELATVDFLREIEFDASGLEPIDLLGGPETAPSEVDRDLSETLAEVRTANWERSATVELAVPIGNDQVATGHGLIDWRTMTAYLNIADTDGYHLLLARPGGLATLATDSDELPLPLPEEGWETHALDDEDVAENFGSIETLVYRMLEMAAEEPEDPEKLAEEATLLRVDGGDEPVHVVEFPVNGDADAAAGQSAFRYHVAEGRLVEVEMMTLYGVASGHLEPEEYPMVAIPWSVDEKIG